MTEWWKDTDLWIQVLIFLGPVITFLLGLAKARLGLPPAIANLVKNKPLMAALNEGVEAADLMKDKSPDEKRKYVLQWASSQIYNLTGDWLPDSTINFLIENLIVRRKAGQKMPRTPG